MNWTNYHGHCSYCDGRGKMEDYIESAINFKMSAIGFSSHAPVPFPTEWNMPKYKLEAYCQEIDNLKEKYQDRIKIFKALEVDYIPEQMSVLHPDVVNAKLDYTVGSVHFMGAFEDGYQWAVDGPVDEFKRALKELFNGDIKSLVRHYYHLQREMLQLATPTIIGHMDKVKMHNRSLNLFDETASWYVDEVHQTLELIKQKGVIVELNTKALFRDNHLFPGPEYLKKIKAMDIPVTINSDAHDPHKLLNGFEEVAGLLLENGITHVHELIDGEWQGVAFSKEALLV